MFIYSINWYRMLNLSRESVESFLEHQNASNHWLAPIPSLKQTWKCGARGTLQGELKGSLSENLPNLPNAYGIHSIIMRSPTQHCAFHWRRKLQICNARWWNTGDRMCKLCICFLFGDFLKRPSGPSESPCPCIYSDVSQRLRSRLLEKKGPSWTLANGSQESSRQRFVIEKWSSSSQCESTPKTRDVRKMPWIWAILSVICHFDLNSSGNERLSPTGKHLRIQNLKATWLLLQLWIHRMTMTYHVKRLTPTSYTFNSQRSCLPKEEFCKRFSPFSSAAMANFTLDLNTLADALDRKAAEVRADAMLVGSTNRVFFAAWCFSLPDSSAAHGEEASQASRSQRPKVEINPGFILFHSFTSWRPQK